MKIGITIQLYTGESFQSNGMFQNLVFLAQAFNTVEGWDCYFLYISDFEPDLIIPKHKCIRFSDYTESPPFEFDVIIFGGFMTDISNYLAFKNTKSVVFHCGATMFDDIFHCISNHPDKSTLTSSSFDAIWTLPHHTRNIGYLRTLYSTENVVIVPYVWDTTFVDLQLNEYGFSDIDEFRYSRDTQPIAQVNVYEPNNTVSKTCLIPLTTLVSHSRTTSLNIKTYNIFSASKIAKSPYFNGRCRAFGITTEDSRKKFLFYKRIPFVGSLRAYGIHPIVLSHQIVHELNNLYFDVLYLGLPLIHNSPILSAYGYYYPEYDVECASSLIDYVLLNHIQNRLEYDQSVISLLDSYHPLAPSNLNFYIELLSDLVST